MRYVHHNKCTGGNAFDEIDGKTYCLGLVDPMFEDTVYCDECKNCPRLLENNAEKLDEYAKAHSTKREVNK